MADYRLSAKIISRSSGRSSVAAAAYRAGQQLHDERTGLDHDYTRKTGVIHSVILAPDDAPEWMHDRAKLWNAVEAAERRKDAQLSREIQLSLPHELDADQNRRLVLDFIQSHFVDHGMVADVAIHTPDRGGDQRNIHAHVMLTTRVLMGDGFGQKNREWNTPEQLQEWRKSWAERQNAEFERLNLEPRVDHRSYADQGIDREPTQHLGPVANDMDKKGRASRVGDENRERQQRNAERAAQAQEATDTTRELAAERERQAEHINAQKAELQSHLLQDQMEMSRRHALEYAVLDSDIERRNGERRAELEAQQRELERQLQAEGWRKLTRDFIGKTRRDQEDLEIVRRNIVSMQQREAEERAAVSRKQELEKAAFDAERSRREQAYAQRLENERVGALEQARKARSPEKAQPAPSNDRQQAPWERRHVPEQDNKGKAGQDFQKAVPAPAERQDGPTDAERAARRERVRAAMAKGKERDGPER